MASGAWTEIYNLISTAVFNGDPSAFTYGELFCEGFAFIACAFLIAIPFIVVWRIIRKVL